MGDWYEQFSQSFKDAAKEMLAKTDIDPNVKCFTRKQMKRISNNYRTILGKGGFSVVYKGRLNDGRAVAVKKYNWKTQKKEFTKEVIIQSQFSHKNIVRLLGCCVEADAPMLVTEFVPNGNLSNLLHSNSSQFPVSLGTRLQIALDVQKHLYICIPPKIIQSFMEMSSLQTFFWVTRMWQNSVTLEYQGCYVWIVTNTQDLL